MLVFKTHIGYFYKYYTERKCLLSFQKSERTKITQALIGVPGIISVTYDLKKNHSIVRGKRTVASEVFGRAVADLALANVYLVRKDENKEEVRKFA